MTSFLEIAPGGDLSNNSVSGLNSTSGDLKASLDLKLATIEEPSAEEGLVAQTHELSPLVEHVRKFFEDSKTKRWNDEQRWLSAYRNYRGLYSDQVSFTDTEKSRAFIKITKTKVLASYAQITEVLFSGTRFPIEIRAKHFGNNKLANKVTVSKDTGDTSGNSLDQIRGGGDPESNPMSRAIRPEILERTGVFKSSLESISDNLKESKGEGVLPDEAVIEPQKYSARKMDKLIQDQLLEGATDKELRRFAFELSLFGHGVMEGPLYKEIEKAFWDKGGKYKPSTKKIAKNSWVSVWDFYPDAEANHIEECEGVVRRHKYSRSQMKRLRSRKTFRRDSIDKAIALGPNYVEEYWEHTLKDHTHDGFPTSRWEVLEYWGIIDPEVVTEDLGIKGLPKNYKDLDSIQINIWVCEDQILRVVVNPFQPQRLPYHSCPYEVNPYSFFGVGVAENMEDTQLIMNGFIRLMIDNAVLSSSLVFEVDETNMVPGQDLTIHPGKVFRRQGGAPGQAVFSHKFQNTINESMIVFDKARQLSDEATGMPSYSHGSTGVMGVGRTASGMSMLMGAAAQNIKAVVRNIDDYLLYPMGRDMLHFNFQFNYDKEFVLEGMEVCARGTDSLMRGEIRSQKILQFLQLTANPVDAPMTRRDYLLGELAASLDLDPELAVTDMDEAKIQAIRQAQIQQPMMAMQNALGGSTQPQQGTGPNSIPAPQGAEAGGMSPGIPQDPNSPSFQANGQAAAPQQMTGM